MQILFINFISLSLIIFIISLKLEPLEMTQNLSFSSLSLFKATIIVLNDSIEFEKINAPFVFLLNSISSKLIFFYVQ